MSEITVGAPAPNFDLPDDKGTRMRLSDMKGRIVALYFYPKDDTPGCTAEAIAFSGLLKDFAAINATVVGVSPDSPTSHAKFREKCNLTVPLASDEERALVNDFGVWVKKVNYGREYMGVERSTFLIDRAGKIARVWRKVKVDGHALEVLDAARALD